jgi:hypothetical protein
MKQDFAMELCDDGADAIAGAGAKRLVGPNQTSRPTVCDQHCKIGLDGSRALVEQLA